MDDYIFLIIAIALSVFGAINQNKKKKAAENLLEEDAEAKPRNFFMDQLLGKDFLGETEEEVRPLPVKVKTTRASFDFKKSIDTTKGKTFKPARFISTLPERQKRETIATLYSIKEEGEEIVGEEESINYLEDFSLRKAFVYSQILERKY